MIKDEKTSTESSSKRNDEMEERNDLSHEMILSYNIQYLFKYIYKTDVVVFDVITLHSATNGY